MSTPRTDANTVDICRIPEQEQGCLDFTHFSYLFVGFVRLDLYLSQVARLGRATCDTVTGEEVNFASDPAAAAAAAAAAGHLQGIWITGFYWSMVEATEVYLEIDSLNPSAHFYWCMSCIPRLPQSSSNI